MLVIFKQFHNPKILQSFLKSHVRRRYKENTMLNVSSTSYRTHWKESISTALF